MNCIIFFFKREFHPSICFLWKYQISCTSKVSFFDIFMVAFKIIPCSYKCPTLWSFEMELGKIRKLYSILTYFDNRSSQLYKSWESLTGCISAEGNLWHDKGTNKGGHMEWKTNNRLVACVEKNWRCGTPNEWNLSINNKVIQVIKFNVLWGSLALWSPALCQRSLHVRKKLSISSDS